MATIKARLPVWIPTNGAAVALGGMMSVSVAPIYEKTSALGGGKLIFKGATVSLNTTHLPTAAYSAMFNADDTTDGELVDGPVCGAKGTLAYITGEQVGNVRSWIVHEIYGVQFIPPADSAVTCGERVTFTTPSLTGEVEESGSVWRKRSFFATESEALEYHGELMTANE